MMKMIDTSLPTHAHTHKFRRRYSTLILYYINIFRRQVGQSLHVGNPLLRS